MKTKTFFNALGRSHRSRGLMVERDRRAQWPVWARYAYAKGWADQAARNG